MRPLLKEARTRKKNKISKRLYESIMDGITSGVWASDKNDIIYYANKAMEMIAGVTHAFPHIEGLLPKKAVAA
jgi:nitrogen fixation/metabolism regulation signal transduction histidine kinase